MNPGERLLRSYLGPLLLSRCVSIWAFLCWNISVFGTLNTTHFRRSELRKRIRPLDSVLSDFSLLITDISQDTTVFEDATHPSQGSHRLGGKYDDSFLIYVESFLGS
ncbi:hypothetical protein AcW1_006372 [Taiwanofungus camphoratus]|nr:hypothetical protein AcW1_006372 [Antrodia cinnamomea]